jgi:hypothetical protein
MRVSCPKCHKRFDVAHRDVLAEALRLAERRKHGDLAGTGNVNGNVLPESAEALREREEAVQRRAR